MDKWKISRRERVCVSDRRVGDGHTLCEVHVYRVRQNASTTWTRHQTRRAHQGLVSSRPLSSDWHILPTPPNEMHTPLENQTLTARSQSINSSIESFCLGLGKEESRIGWSP